MGYYNEHPTMVGGLICESSFFGLRTLSRDSLNGTKVLSSTSDATLVT